MVQLVYVMCTLVWALCPSYIRFVSRKKSDGLGLLHFDSECSSDIYRSLTIQFHADLK